MRSCTVCGSTTNPFLWHLTGGQSDRVCLCCALWAVRYLQEAWRVGTEKKYA